MNFQQLLDSVFRDTGSSLAAFRPEVTLCATIVLILLLRVIGFTSKIDSFYVALIGAAVALWLAGPWQNATGALNVVRQPLFTGMLVYDSLTMYMRVILLFFAVLFTIFTRISGIPDRDSAPDFYVLALGATLGMCLMASANHLLMIFLGVEMASVPSYALAGMLKGRRASSEAALKYAIYGAGTAGIMLYGISLLAGALGSAHIPTIAVRLAEQLQTGVGSDRLMVLALGGLMMSVGLAFKLSAVPFHFWCPDVFEGASAEVAAFLSIASKAAALALLIRVVVGFGYVNPAATTVPAISALYSVADSAEPNPPAASDAHRGPARVAAPATPEQSVKALAPVRNFMAKLLAFIAVITCTFGNLAAYGQTNIKRLLAYSTIAHAGYMMMAIAAAIVLAGHDPAGAERAIGALVVYIGIYLFMNLGAFAVVAFLRNELRSENIADYAGLIRRAPIVTVCFSLLLVSLIGLPPLSGFVGKFVIFAALVDADMILVLVIAGLNTAISLFYYLRVVKTMTMDPEPRSRLPISLSFIPGTFVMAMTVPTVFLGVWWNGLNQWAQAAAAHLFH